MSNEEEGDGIENINNDINQGSNHLEGENISAVKVPYQKGDKTIKCWNCESILMIKDRWKVVQCPTCEKVCKIPEEEKRVEGVVYNKYVNHFDVNMPTVFSVLVCPFCKTDNKIRATADHMKCYKCHNSVNITNDRNKMSMNADIPQFNNNSRAVQAKSARFSDMFFPDPMFYPGIYPMMDSYSPMYNNYNPYMAQDFITYRTKQELYSNYMNRRNQNSNNYNKGRMEHIRNHREPIKNVLENIKKSLHSNDPIGYVDSEIDHTLNQINNNHIKSIGPVESGFEDKIKLLKEKLMKNKKDKNRSILDNLMIHKYK